MDSGHEGHLTVGKGRVNDPEPLRNKKFAHPSRNISRPGSTPGGDSIIRKEVGKSPAY
jgi:hypothetical protein